MPSISTSRLIISYFTRFLGIFLVIFSLLAAIKGIIAVMNINKDGSTGVRTNTEESSDYYIITNISENYPAYTSGLQTGDTLIRVNGIPVSEKEQLKKELARREVGGKLVYTVKRGASEKNYELVL